MSLLINTINFILFGFLYRKIKIKKIKPLTQWWFWLIFFAFLNYSFKGFLLKIIPLESITFPFHIRPYLHSIEDASLFSSLFVLVGLFFSFFFFESLIYKIDDFKLSNKHYALNYVLVSVTIFVNSYAILASNFFALSIEGEMGILDLIILNLMPFTYIGFFVSLISYHSKKTLTNFICIILYLTCIFAITLLSTSKAPIILVLLIYVFFVSVMNIKISRLAVLIILFFILLSFLYSYYSRYYFDVYNNAADFTLVISTIINDPNLDLNSFLINPLITRFELLDNLCVLLNKRDNIDMGLYTFGSFVEILNLIPRAIWESRPNLKFSYFVTQEIFDSNFYWSASIGRFGEAFLMLNKFAVFSFPFFFVFFKKIKQFILSLFNDYFLKVIALFIFLRFFIWFDDFLFQNLFTFIYTLIIFKIITSVIKFYSDI